MEDITRSCERGRVVRPVAGVVDSCVVSGLRDFCWSHIERALGSTGQLVGEVVVCAEGGCCCGMEVGLGEEDGSASGSAFHHPMLLSEAIQRNRIDFVDRESVPLTIVLSSGMVN